MCGWPFTPNDLLGILEIHLVLFDFFTEIGEGKRPIGVVLDSLHKFAGNQQREIELP